MEIQLTGMKEMVAKLESLRAEVSGPGMEKALRAGGRVIRDAMKSRTPVVDKRTPGSTALEPGALRAGIRSYVPKGKPTTVLIGPAERVAHVARFVEYGHRQVTGGYLKLLANGKTQGKGSVVGFVPAHPFLRPAFESSVAAAEVAIVASISKTIEEQVG